MKKTFCFMPFVYCEVNPQGDVYICCDRWCNGYSIGNIFNDDFDEIWNGEKKKIFVEQFKTQEFKYCNFNVCPIKKECSTKELNDYLNHNFDFDEKIIRFSFDTNCNLKCIFCRPDYCNGKDSIENNEKMKNSIKRLLPDLDKDNWTISVNGVGEVFTSKYHLEIIKEIIENYKNINFRIITNGVLCSKEKIENIGLHNRLIAIECSVHAFKKKTYNKIIKGGNFDKVKTNVEYMSSLKKQGKMKDFRLNFVVNSQNYKEMADFAKWALELEATPTFLPLLEFPQVESIIYKNLNISDSNHPKYNDFVKTLQNPIFKDERISMPRHYLELEPTKTKNIFKKLFNL